MSGGVDSSATAAILCQKGYDCIGVTMKLYNLPDDAVRSNTCCTLSDAEDAKSVAYRLGMRYYVMNFTADFAKEVITVLYLPMNGAKRRILVLTATDI